MTIRTSYAGYISQRTDLKTLDHEIAKILIRSSFPSDGPDIKFVTDKHDDVPSFIHPYWRQAEDVVYIDTRGYSTVTADGTHTFRYGEEYDIWMYRAKLELAWVRGDKAEMYTAFQFANEVFVRWFTSLIAHQYGLSPIHETQLMCCVALFNVGRYFNKVDGFRMTEKYVQQIVSTYRIDVGTAFQIADLVGDQFPSTIDEFIDLVQRANISAALSTMTRVSISNTLGSSFFLVANSPQIVALALEYPPAFVALVLMAFKHTTIRNKTQIGQRVYNSSMGQKDKYFLRAVESTMDRHMDDVKPGRSIANEHYGNGVGNEVAGTLLAAVAGGAVILAFIAWLIDKVFDGDKSPDKRAKDAKEELEKALTEFKVHEAAVVQRLENAKTSSWPSPDEVKALGDDNKKIFDTLLQGISIPAFKLAVYDFAKSGGKSSNISMGKLKYDGANGSTFHGNLQKAAQAVSSYNTNTDPYIQSVIYALLSNRPFSIGAFNNADLNTKIGAMYTEMASVLAAIKTAADAGNAEGLSTVASTNIVEFDTKVKALVPAGTATPAAGTDTPAGPGEAATQLGTLKEDTYQFFDKETGIFVERKDDLLDKIIKAFGDPASALALATENENSSKALKAIADNNQSAFKTYENLGMEMNNKFTPEQQQTDGYKRCAAFVTSKSKLLDFTSDAINNTANMSKSIKAFASTLLLMSSKGPTPAPAGETPAVETPKPADPAKPADTPAT